MNKKLENIWYYYKYYILVGALILIATVFGIASCVGRGTYDVNILYMTHGYVDMTGEMDELFGKYASDTNGDGIANAQVLTINYGTTLSEAQSAGSARSANLASGKNVLFLMDEQNYNELNAGGFLMDISTLGESQYLSANAFDATASGMLSPIEGLTVKDQQYYFGILTYDEARAKTDAKYAAQYDAAFGFMKNVIEQHG